MNAGSVSFAQLKIILDHTKYKAATENNNLDTGEWFPGDPSRREFPDFVSSYSYNSDPPSQGGWRPKKEDFPDLWINPEK